MKIYIIYQTQDTPSGGGNQFLKALSQKWAARGRLATDPEQADAFLFNSHHCLDEVLRLKLAYPDKPFFHRIDGPMKLYNSADDRRDGLTYWANEKVADATIFQSHWSQRMNAQWGMPPVSYSTTILNAPDPEIFQRRAVQQAPQGRRPRLVATSWSDNMNKGFEVYRFLDRHYVGKLFDLTFIGRSPLPFDNIVHLPPAGSRELAAELVEHDIFLTASKADPCSNSLIEALHCGLPAIVYNDGGHPEIVDGAGLTFDTPEQIPALVEQVVARYAELQAAIALPDIDEVAQRYFDFIAGTTEQLGTRIKNITNADLKSRKRLGRKKSLWRKLFHL